MKKQKVIKSDVFDICKRIKELDQSYYVVYNFQSNKFEVHSDSQRGNSLCFVVPFDKLDARTVEYARKTSVARKDKIIEEIDRENELVQKRSRQEVFDHLREVLE